MKVASFFERPSYKKVFAAETGTASEQQRPTMQTDKPSSALKKSTLQKKSGLNVSPTFANGNKVRAVSFSEEKESTAQTKGSIPPTESPSPNSSPSPRRSGFLKRTKKSSTEKTNETMDGPRDKENSFDNPGSSDGDARSSSSPRKWGSRRFRKGFSFFGSGSGDRKNGYGTLSDNNNNNNKNNDDNDPDTQPVVETDPVMTIFESRNTQRVRFTLSGDGESAKSGNMNKDASNSSKRGVTSSSGSSGGGNIKQFMSRALFGSKSSAKKLSEEEMKREVKELGGGSLIWESASTPTGPEVIHTKNSKGNRRRSQKTQELTVSFTEDPKARAAVTKLLNKADQAEHIHFRYEYAVKCYLKALNILQKQAKYPDDHPTVVKTVHLMNNAHNVLVSYNNSANIVKMGIKNEDAGELVKALKMYTIAYRIRRDNLSPNHPSLVVLLNMLGSIQIKRGELNEAMQIYELALNDESIVLSPSAISESEFASFDQSERQATDRNLLAKSVTFREMGTIYEMWGRVDEALKFYHKSLECVAAWRETIRSASTAKNERRQNDTSESSEKKNDPGPQHYTIDNVQTVSGGRDQETELVFGPESHGETSGNIKSPKKANKYEKFFPNGTDVEKKNGNKVPEENSHADMDLSLTLHQIARLYCSQGKFNKALDAYEAALKGMKTALGKHHPNVAAVLGNIGNLQKEMGDLDAAYSTYQEVLGIESYRLGLSHPDVAITLHNIATIDAARGNYEHALQLYRKVIGLQKKLFGEGNLSVSVTAACMGDVYEKIGDIESSVKSFDEAVRIKSSVLGRHSLEVGRLLHKLAKLSFFSNDYLEAESYISRTILIYRLNKLDENHEWFVDANRDSGDIDGAIATGVVDQCEI